MTEFSDLVASIARTGIDSYFTSALNALADRMMSLHKIAFAARCTIDEAREHLSHYHGTADSLLAFVARHGKFPCQVEHFYADGLSVYDLTRKLSIVVTTKDIAIDKQ